MPSKHEILHSIVQELKLPTLPFCHMEKPVPITAKNYFRNKHVSAADELRALYSVGDVDAPYFFPFSDTEPDFEFSADGNPQNSRIISSGRLAKDMTVSEYISLSNNASMFTRGHPMVPDTLTMANAIITSGYSKSGVSLCVEGEKVLSLAGGMEEVTKALVRILSESLNVSLHSNCPVNRIEEAASDDFTVISLDEEAVCKISVRCKKIILACNGRGMDYITWISKYNRTTQLQKLIGQVERGKSFKIFLTYKSFWWEKLGLPSGTLLTDLPIRSVSSFGDRGKNCVYATLLASYSLKNIEIFEGLNNERAEKYLNKVGDIPQDLTPSKGLVDYVQKQLKSVFGKLLKL